MPLSVTPSPSGMTAPAPALVQPADLQPALDRLHQAYREGFISQQDIQKRTEIGNTDAQAQRKQNEAAGATAEQERIKQEGGKGYTRPGTFARLTGIGTAPKPVVPKPTLEPKNDPNAIYAPAVDVQPRPYLQRALESPDFNPAHESTDDLLNLVQEAGYQV